MAELKRKPRRREPSSRHDPPHVSPTVPRHLPDQSPPLRMVPAGLGLVRVAALGLHLLLRKSDIQGQRGHLERDGDQTIYGQRDGADDTVAPGTPRRGGCRGQQFGEQDWEFEFERLWGEKRLWGSGSGTRSESDECEGCLKGLSEECGHVFSGRL